MPGRSKPNRRPNTAASPQPASATRTAPDAGRGSPTEKSDVVPTIVVPSTVAQNEFGRVFDRAMAGTDIAIAKHSVVRAYLVSAARYHELVGQPTVDLDALSSRFEQLYASMQRPAVRAATNRALRSTPEAMGKAAVAAARRPRRQAAGKPKNR